MLRFERAKKHNVVASAVYRLSKLLPLSRRTKLGLFSELAWICTRIASESANRLVSRDKNPATARSDVFILSRIKPDDFVLEVGCAHGHITMNIAHACKKAVGIDHNPKLITSAKKANRLGNAEFVCGDALDFIASPDANFNVMICSHIIGYFEEPVIFLKSIMPKVERVYLEVPDNDASAVNHIRSSLGFAPLYMDKGHVWEFTRDDVAHLVDSAGYRIIEAEYSFSVMRLWIEPQAVANLTT
jgi:SAM-dependent methyltransferase